MKVTLNNIGIIKDSVINIDGLTVITGDNNSGKSTIGKAVCSVINSTLNLREKNFSDKRLFTVSIVNDAIRYLDLEYFYRSSQLRRKQYDTNLPKLIMLALQGDFSFIFDAEDDEKIKQILLDMIDEIKSLDFSSIENINQNIIRRSDKLYLNERIQKSIRLLQNQIQRLYDDMNLTKYAENKIILGLNSAFNEQIQPVMDPNAMTKIAIEDDGVLCYDLEFLGNKIKKCNFYKNPFVFAHYISDCNILDKIATYFKYDGMRKRDLLRYRMGFEDDGETLEEALLNNLVKRNNAYEMQQYADKYKIFLKMINQAFSDEIVFSDGKYVCKETKLDVKNLATGSKLFAIFKMLLENGSINSETLIVLDEPENHLHPKWQLILADVITKLIKQFSVKFIVTTHSPNFLVALNTYSEQEGIKSDYYYTSKMSNNYNVKIDNVNDRMEDAYYALNKPFIDINNIFESLEDGDDE